MDVATNDTAPLLVPGGALLVIDGKIHIDLDRPHMALTQEEAMQFAGALMRIADFLEADTPRIAA